MAYLTPTEQWLLARPGSIPLSSWAPGEVSDVTKTGTGSATMTASGYPLDAAAVRVRCFVGGEPGGAARVKWSIDGGVTYPGGLLAVPLNDGLSLPLMCAGDVALSFTAGAAPSFVVGDVFAFSTTASPEILAQIEAAGAAPSFVVGDVFAFSTTASPEILAQIEAASAEADGYMGDVFALPLSAWGLDIKRYVALLARDHLTSNRGMPNTDEFAEARKTAVKWWTQVALGNVKPRVTEAAGGAVVFSDFVKPRGKYKTDWRV